MPLTSCQLPAAHQELCVQTKASFDLPASLLLPVVLVSANDTLSTSAPEPCLHVHHSSVFFISSQLLHSLVTKSVLCPHFSILPPLVLPHKISHWTTYKQSRGSFHAALHSVFSLRRAISSTKWDWPWFKGHQWTWYSDRVPQPDLQGLLVCHTLGLLTTSLKNYWRTILNSI